MKILVTGSRGFIGKNLVLACRELNHEVVEIFRDTSEVDMIEGLRVSDAVVHLAGINRPNDIKEFHEGNVELTKKLCDTILRIGRKIPIIYSSSVQANLDNPYGKSKFNAEKVISDYAAETKALTKIYRFPNVFGKWSKPNYNSAVATFCHSIANDKAYTVHDRNMPLTLIYIDDVVNVLIKAVLASMNGGSFPEIDQHVYSTSVGDVSDILEGFKLFPQTLEIGRVGNGLIRALYSTYISFLPPSKFSLKVKKYADARGDFVEMLKTSDAGQFSYFTALCGVTRGGHYHHTKTEKFLVISGKAEFRFRNILTNEKYTLITDGNVPEIVDTIPGWAHDITNIGDDKLVVMLWANEIFNRDLPDTISAELI
ncbi:MAG: NAD-dependent epimerase/dehydratase family protein [Pseudomonadota bacterium]